MRRSSILAVTTASLLILSVALSVGNAVAQQKSLKEQLVGTWMLVSIHSVRNDGSRLDASGPNPKGIVIYTSDGHFAFINTRPDLPKFASNTRDQGTPEEYKAVVQGSLAYFGTYSVNEADKVINVQVEGSTFANLIGMVDQKRTITSLTDDELKFRNPATPSGATLEVAWKRAK
jgi:Lipocalin-like domain